MQTDPPNRRSSKESRIPSVRVAQFLDRYFLLLVAFIYATLHLLHYSYNPPQLNNFSFWGGENGSIASSIAQGKGFTNPFPRAETGPSAWVAPPFPYLLAAIFRIAGTQTEAAAHLGLFVQWLIYGASLGLLYQIVHRTFSDTSARCAVLIWLFNPTRIGLTSKLLSEVCITIVAILLAIYALIRFQQNSTQRAASLAGLAMGFAVVCLPTIVVAFPFYIYAFYRVAKNHMTLKWFSPAAVCALCIVVLTPWMVRNYVVFGKFVFVKSNFGQVLFASNNERVSPWESYTYVDVTEKALLQQMGEIAYNRYSLLRGLAWIATHKYEYALRCLKRIPAFWLENPATGIKSRVWLTYQVLLLMSAVIGLWGHWRRTPVTAFCFVMLLAVPSVYYLTGVPDGHRLRLPSDPLLAIFASGVLAKFLRRWDAVYS